MLPRSFRSLVCLAVWQMLLFGVLPVQAVLLAAEDLPPPRPQSSVTGEAYSPTSQPAGSRWDQSAFAADVERTLREASSLTFEAELTAGKYRGRVNVEMGQGSLRSEAYIDRQLSASWTLKDGKVTEFRSSWSYQPDVTYRNATLTYDAPSPNGTDMALMSAPTDCLFGNYLQSWVGPESYFADFFRRRIEYGVQQPDADVDGHRCRVIAFEQQSGDYSRKDVFYFDASTKLIRKWETFDRENVASAYALSRTREFHKMKLGEARSEKQASARDVIGTSTDSAGDGAHAAVAP